MTKEIRVRDLMTVFEKMTEHAVVTNDAHLQELVREAAMAFGYYQHELALALGCIEEGAS